MNNARIFRIFFLSFLTSYVFLAGPALEAQVNSGELESSRNERVVFINYEGPHSRIETLEQIRSIGSGLGSIINRGTARAGGTDRYYIIHSVSPEDDVKLDADIMGLGVDVGVDHIRNLRYIIQGYLQTAYEYTGSDALLLAEYVTIYNAVHRGNWDFYNSRYKNPVMTNLNRSKAGISTRFDEWPGRTEMVVPLNTRGGPLSTVDTSSLTDKDVIEEMRKQEDMGIEQRKEMVDLKEREADQAQQRAAGQREAIRQEEKRIQEQKAAVAEEKQQTQDPKKQEELKEKEEDLAKQEEDLESQKEEAARTEQFAEQKAAEAQQERESIAKDQQSLITQEGSKTGDPASYLGIKMNDPVSFLCQLVRIRQDNGEILSNSPLNTINSRSINFSGKRILAIAGDTRSKNGAIRLVQIDMDSLLMQKQGVDDIHPQSLLWMNVNDLYAVNVTAGKLYLARFNTELERLARSTVTVHPNATVLFQGDMLLTQRSDGSVLFLNPTDLSEKGFQK